MTSSIHGLIALSFVLCATCPHFAAINNMLSAIVFNSDMLNPLVFDHWATRNWGMTSLTREARIAETLRACIEGYDDRRLQSYLRTGNITDIRMTNDPLTSWIFWLCSNNLPHARIHWVSNTLSCSAANGHSMENLVRELVLCR